MGGRSFALSRAFSAEPLEEMKQLKVAHSYQITDFPEYSFLPTDSCIDASSSGCHVDTAASSTGVSVAEATGGALLAGDDQADLTVCCSGGGLDSTCGDVGCGPSPSRMQSSGSPPPAISTSSLARSPVRTEEEATLHPIALRFAPELLESSLSGKSWGATLGDFFRLHCSRFRDFDPGTEFDVVMTEVHKSFCVLLEGLITEELGEMGLDPDSFGDILAQREVKASDDPIVLSLAGKIRKYADFREFGQLMHEKFIELYAATRVPGESAALSGCCNSFGVTVEAEIRPKDSLLMDEDVQPCDADEAHLSSMA